MLAKAESITSCSPLSQSRRLAASPWFRRSAFGPLNGSNLRAIPSLQLRSARRAANRPCSLPRSSTTISGAACCGKRRDSLFICPHGEAAEEVSARYFVRLPQENQSAETLGEHLRSVEVLLAEAREFWRNWKPFGTTNWSFPGRHGEFLTACARNIQQAREVKNDRLVFQVGPTQYRGLWIVDGNFLLEAARYLGYDQATDEGLRSEWTKQADSGQVIAESGGEHWKDTAIAMFTLVRQCELKQDWTFFRELEPNVVHALDFLISLRDQARSGPSINGRYGLLAPGFADGGIGGVRSEFTNTVWTLAALRAVADAADQLKMSSLARARTFFRELYDAFQRMAKREMVRHTAGFEYLPRSEEHTSELQSLRHLVCRLL